MLDVAAAMRVVRATLVEAQLSPATAVRAIHCGDAGGVSADAFQLSLESVGVTLSVDTWELLTAHYDSQCNGFVDVEQFQLGLSW